MVAVCSIEESSRSQNPRVNWLLRSIFWIFFLFNNSIFFCIPSIIILVAGWSSQDHSHGDPEINARYTVWHIITNLQFSWDSQLDINCFNKLPRGGFCKFSFQWIYYSSSNKFTRLETGKLHLCAPCYNQRYRSRFFSPKIHHNGCKFQPIHVKQFKDDFLVLSFPPKQNFFCILNWL